MPMILNSSTAQLYFITLTAIKWLDVFQRPIYKHCIIDSLKYCQHNKGLEIFAWVLMPNHMHMIVSGRQAGISLPEIIRDFKKFTAKQITNAIIHNTQESKKEFLTYHFAQAAKLHNKNHGLKLWQNGYHPEILNSDSFIRQKLDYLHNNPVRQEIVARPEDYLYSSAMDYAGIKGLLDITLIE